MVEEEIKDIVAANLNDYDRERPLEKLLADAATILPLPLEVNSQSLSKMEPNQVEEKLMEQVHALYQKREEEMGTDNMRLLERLVMLRNIDTLWVEHLTAMEYMRQGIGLQAMAQRDPLVAYKQRSHAMFQDLTAAIQHSVTHSIFKLGIKKGIPPPKPKPAIAAVAGDTGGDGQKPPPTSGKKVGRNDPCPCGSGKKFKKCCGK
jgi:preprotein translocase subunit SecA